MGQLSHDPYLNHFSHRHPLELTSPQTPTPPCAACTHPSHGGAWMYSCQLCRFSLHVSCTQMCQLITHPSHPHPLTLLPTPAYGGLFSCDGCGHTGAGFSYHCGKCNFDIHALCANKPLTVCHVAHPQHELKLTFEPPYENKGFSCDICRRIGTSQWIYRCDPCEFDTHMDCVAANHHPQAHLLQHNSFHVAHLNNSVPHPQHNNSFPGPHGQNNNFAANSPNGSIFQGIIQGAAEQAAQTFVQGMGSGDCCGGRGRGRANDSMRGGEGDIDSGGGGGDINDGGEHGASDSFAPPAANPGDSYTVQPATGLGNPNQYMLTGGPGNLNQFASTAGRGDMSQYARNMGFHGPTSFNGPNRPVGFSQTNVSNGPSGPNGSVGLNGSNGSIGFTGPVGPNGSVGSFGHNGPGNMIMSAMVQGFVEGAAQQVGQTFVQSMMGGVGGGNDGGDPTRDGGGGGASIISIGSSVLGGLFGNDSESQY